MRLFIGPSSPHLSWNAREAFCVYEGRPGFKPVLIRIRAVERSEENFGVWKMKESNNVMRTVGIILLALFILVVGAGLLKFLAIGVVGLIVGLVVGLIKLAIVVAIIYLVLVGIRAMLR